MSIIKFYKMEFYKIPNLSNFEITKSGVIRNIYNKKIKSQYINSSGYYLITVSNNNKSKPYRVHRLIALTFMKNPNNYPHINHKNGIKTDNRISNLEWCTHLQNMKHAIKNKLINNTGEKNGMSKLNNSDVLKIKKLLKEGLSQQKIAEMFNVSRSAILKINLNKTWTHI